MSNRARKWALAAAVGVLPASAFGQTWIGSAGSWSDATKWTSAPAPAPTTSLMFPMLGAGSLAYTSTNDLPGAFTLDDLVVGGVAGGSLTIGSSPISSLRFSPLQSPGITVTTGGDVRVNARISSPGASLTLLPASGGTLRLAAPMYAPLGMTAGAPGGTVSLDAANRIGGLVTAPGTTGNLAAVNIANVNSLGGALFVANGAILSLGSVTFATQPAAAPFLPNNIAVGGDGLQLGDGKSFTLTGNIAGGGPIVVKPSALTAGTWTLAGDNSGFGGNIAVHAAPGSGSILLTMLAFTGPAAIGNAQSFSITGMGAGIGLMGGSTLYSIARPLNLLSSGGQAGGSIGVFDAGGRADITWGGPIAGVGGLNRVGGGVLQLTNSNTFLGGLTLSGGVTTAAFDANLGASTGSVTLDGGDLLLQTGFGTPSARTLRLSNLGGTLYVSDNVTWSGLLTNTTPVPGQMTKAGAGNLSLTNNGNSVGSVLIAGGSVTVGGVSGRLIATGSIGVQHGGALVLDNSAAALARISGTAPINLSGGTLRLIGNATTNTSAVTTGSLSLGAIGSSGQGLNVIRLEPGATSHALVRFGSLSRQAGNGAQLLVSGPSLGDFPIASLSAGRSNLQFTTAPALTNGILPFAIVERVGTGIDLASYTAANGVVAATYTSNTINNGTLLTANVQVGSDATVGAATINAAKFTGGTINLSAGTLVVTSGALLFTGPTTITGGTLTIGVGTNNATDAPIANLFTHADTTISSRLFTFFQNNQSQPPGGIAKSGPGVLTLAATGNTYNGLTRIFEGTLRLGATEVIPNGSAVVLEPGAVFDLNGFNETIGSLGQVSNLWDIGNDGFGTVIIGSAVLTTGGGELFGGGNTSYIGHNIIGNGGLIKNGTGTFTVLGHQAFTGTVTVAAGTLALATHHSLGTGLANVQRINLGLAGQNSDVALRIEDNAAGFNRPIFAQAQTGRTATLVFGDNVAADITAPINLTNAQGLIIDAAGGVNLTGGIIGTGPLSIVSSSVLPRTSRTRSVRIAGSNTYIGTTTLAADTIVWGHPSAFGSSATAIQLGSFTGDDTPELAGDVGGLTLARQISVADALSSIADRAYLSSRVPAGGGTLTYSGTISFAGTRSQLILFSTGEPLVVSGNISTVAGAPASRLQIGHQFSADDVTTRSQVILAGANTYTGGTTLAAGTLGINGASVLSVPASTLLNSPIGTGPLTIGISTLAVGHEPTLLAVGTARTLFNPVTVTRNFIISGSNPLTLAGAIDLGSSARVITVDPTAVANFAGALGGSAGAALIKEGGGTLTLSAVNNFVGDVVVNDGTAMMSAVQRYSGRTHVGPGATARLASGSSAVLVTAALSVDAGNGGVLDVTRSGAIVDYTGASPLTSVTRLIATGYAGGAWNGAGIHSSTAAGQTNTGVGIAEAAELGTGSFLGQGFTGDAVLLRYTLYGDNDLNGSVGLGDFALLASNFNTPGRWFTGDFNYSGTVDISDFALQAANFNQVLAALSAAGHPMPVGTVIPEPGCGIIAAGLAGLALRRRRF